MNYINNKIEGIKRYFSKTLGIFANHLFLIFLLLLLLDSVLIGYLFFKYSVQEDNIPFQGYTVGLNQEVLNNVLEEWGDREKLFEMVDSNKYLDLFRF
jgi:hypothetical protein